MRKEVEGSGNGPVLTIWSQLSVSSSVTRPTFFIKQLNITIEQCKILLYNFTVKCELLNTVKFQSTLYSVNTL
jgi:hypothetical protein